MSGGLHQLILFLGHFHPLLVHLPIGGLVMLGVLELAGRFPRFSHAPHDNRWLVGLATATAVVAALCGWMLSQSGEYDPELLQWHKWAGFSVAAGCVVTWVLHRLNRARAYQLSLLATLVLVAVAGHLGGSITHGRDFLTRYAPAPLRGLLGAQTEPATATPPAPGLAQPGVFPQVIEPILHQRCWACHSPEKHKADLRMDSLAALLAGGKNGPVLVPGNARESLMIQRLLLPMTDDDHMPPEGKPQPTPAELVLLQWWINAGAPTNQTAAAPKPQTSRP
jgi:uncharacterized membrane protein